MPVREAEETGQTQAGEIELEALKTLREAFTEEWGFDPEDVWEQSDKKPQQFSIKKVRESIRKEFLREAVSETAFAQLVRYGVQRTMISNYNQVPTIYQNLMQQVASKTMEEMFAPLYGLDVPVAVKDGEPAPESRMAGLERRVQNQEFARIFPVSKRLFDDDQTGQIKRAASKMGGRMKYAEELLGLGVYIALPANTEPTYLTNVAGQAGTAVTTTAGPLSGPYVEIAWECLTSIVDPLGNLISIIPDAVVVAQQDKLSAKKILLSDYVTAPPSVAGTYQPGVSGYWATNNALKDEDLRIEASQFVRNALVTAANPNGYGIDAASRRWMLVQSMESDAFVNRTPLQVTQEDPNAGDSFKNREYRYQMQRRFSAVTIDYSFKFWGN